ALAEQYRRVVIVSGRPAGFLRDRLEVVGTPLLAYGLYGLEWVTDGRTAVRPDAQQWAGPLEDYAQAADATAPPGVTVERKGLGVTLHVRNAPEHATWA